MNVWKLYYNCKIIPTENYKVDSIEDYLSTLTKDTINDGQYIKHNLNLMLKINKSQSILAFSNSEDNLNYISIENGQDVYPVYYFVMKKEWISENTIQLVLKMDVINTFTTERNSFTFSDRTLVNREHKNRFKVDNEKIYSNIDIYNEGINPQLYIKTKQKLYDPILPNYSWYLIYMNQNEPSESLTNPVNIYLCASSVASIIPLGGISGGTITYSNLDENVFYYIDPDENGREISLTVGETTITARILSSSYEIIRLYRRNNIIYVNKLSTTAYNLNGTLILDSALSASSITFGDSNSLTYHYSSEIAKTVNQLRAYSQSIFTYTYIDVASIDSVDRTNSKIIKIIKLPYCPTNPTYENGHFNFDNTKWEFDTQYSILKLKNITSNSLKFEREMNFTTSILSPIGNDYSGEKSKTSLKNISYEMKLYHSDFYYLKYIYDTFSYVLKLEQLSSFDNTIKTDYKIKFLQTKTINSRFLFSVGVDLSISNEDYPCFINVSRNNEETIYNTPYINYIRAGYNYDVKAKNRTEAFSWFSTALSIGAGALNVAFGFKSLGVALFASSIASISNAINTTISAEQNLEAKINQLEWQTASVYGSDNVDLMSEYCENILQLHIYETSPKMKEVLFDLFYYTGYIANIQKVPDFTSRIWFNFVSCEPILENIKSIPDECIEELTQRLRGGITNLHMNLINGVKTWDFARIYENWETIFFN